MENRNLIKLIDSEGNENIVEYVTELTIDNNLYLVYDRDIKKDDSEDCCIVKLLSDENGEYIIDEISDKEYIDALDMMCKLLKMKEV